MGKPRTIPAKLGWDLLLLALAAVVMAYVWRLQDLFPLLAKLKFPLLAAAGAIVLFLIDGDGRRLIRDIKHPIVVLALVILGLMILSVPGSLYRGLSFRFIVKDHATTFVMMVLLAASIRHLVDVERFLGVHLAGASLFCLTVLTRYEVEASGRLGSLVYYDSNDLAMLIVCTLPLALYFVAVKRGWRGSRGLSLLAIGLMIITLVRTGSRGGFIGLLAVSGFMLIGFSGIPKRVRLGAGAGILLLLTVLASDTYWATMSTLLNPKADYNWAGQAESGRMEVWKRGIGYMLDRPFLGVGARAFVVAEGTLAPEAALQEYGRGFKWSSAHNSFVQIGAELGVFGLAAFIALLVVAFRNLWGLRRAPPGGYGSGRSRAAMASALTACLVGYVVTGFFLSLAYSAYLYSVLGIVLAFVKVSAVARIPAAVHSAVRRGPRWRRVVVRGPSQRRPRSVGLEAVRRSRLDDSGHTPSL